MLSFMQDLNGSTNNKHNVDIPFAVSFFTDVAQGATGDSNAVVKCLVIALLMAGRVT